MNTVIVVVACLYVLGAVILVVSFMMAEYNDDPDEWRR